MQAKFLITASIAAAAFMATQPAAARDHAASQVHIQTQFLQIQHHDVLGLAPLTTSTMGVTHPVATPIHVDGFKTRTPCPDARGSSLIAPLAERPAKFDKTALLITPLAERPMKVDRTLLSITPTAERADYQARYEAALRVLMGDKATSILSAPRITTFHAKPAVTANATRELVIHVQPRIIPHPQD